MQQWEYLMVRIVPIVGGREYSLSPRQLELEDTVNLQNVGPNQTATLMSDLGELGWEMVTADVQADTFWLKRPTPPSGEPQVY